MLLLERNEIAHAVNAHRIGFVLGYRNDETPIVEIRQRADCDYHRLLVYGSGRESRSRVIRGTILGATKNVEDVMSPERRIVSAGKFDRLYLSSSAPSRLPASFAPFDLAIVTFDVQEDIRAFRRAGAAALAFRKQGPVIFAASQNPSEEQLKWCQERGIESIADAKDGRALRERIAACLSNPDSNRIQATAEDLAEEAREQRRKEKISGKSVAKRNGMFLALVVLLVAVSLLVLPQKLHEAVPFVPAAGISLLISLVGAAACVKIMQDM